MVLLHNRDDVLDLAAAFRRGACAGGQGLAKRRLGFSELSSEGSVASSA